MENTVFIGLLLLTRPCLSKCGLGPVLSPGDLSKMHVLGPQPGLPNPKLQVGPVVNKSRNRFQNHGTGPFPEPFHLLSGNYVL